MSEDFRKVCDWFLDKEVFEQNIDMDAYNRRRFDRRLMICHR